MTTGYHHPLYAASLAGEGTPLRLPESKGWLIRRRIFGSLYDAMGPYPLMACADWSALPADLEELQGDLVSVSGVVDPFGDHDEDLLRTAFPDLVRPFKEHLTVDLEVPLRVHVSSHHRRNAAKGFQAVQVERVEHPEALHANWVRLYSTLVDRHAITGVAAFSPEAFASQLAVPGVVAFRAVRAGETVGMVLWYVTNGVAYYHLGAYSDAGYEHRASFALFWAALEQFAADGAQWASLGSGAGLTGSEDGLTRFKRGWATGTRTAYLCGRILDRERYDELVASREISETAYFPAYRAREVAHAWSSERSVEPEPSALVLTT